MRAWLAALAVAASFPMQLLAQISVFPLNVDFGSVVLGNSAQRNVNVEVTGTGVVAIFGVTSPPFAEPLSCTPGVPACTLPVSFTPTTFGTQSGNLRVTVQMSTGALIVTNVPLMGIGVARSSVSVQVTGPGDVTSTPVGVSCGSQCTATFDPPSASLQAAPQAGARFLGWGGVCASAGSNPACTVPTPFVTRLDPLVVTAAFAMIPRVEVDVRGLRFGPTPLGEDSTEVTISAVNMGDAVNLQGLSVSGDQASEFIAKDDACPVGLLSPGGVCEVTITFLPVDLGTRIATLNLEFTGAEPITIYLSGIGAPNIPSAPRDAVVAGANKAAVISFSPPSSDGGSAITSYVATCLPGDVTAVAPSSPVVVNGLSNGSTYACSVSATNAVGTGPASPFLTVKPPH